MFPLIIYCCLKTSIYCIKWLNTFQYYSHFILGKMQKQINSTNDSYLYKSLRKLYFFGQIFGGAMFSYSPQIGVHVTPINIACFLLTTVYCCILTYINVTMELKIDADGIQFMLFYLGMKVFPTMMSLLAWSQSLSLLLNRKKIAKLMEEILALEIEVR